MEKAGPLRDRPFSCPIPEGSERLAHGHADLARRADVVAEACAATAFAVEREQRRFVEQVVGIYQTRRAVPPVQPRRDVDEVVAWQLIRSEVVGAAAVGAGCRIEEQRAAERACAGLLIRGLGEA